MIGKILIISGVVIIANGVRWYGFPYPVFIGGFLIAAGLDYL